MADDEFGGGGGESIMPPAAPSSPAAMLTAPLPAAASRAVAQVHSLGDEEVTTARELLADMDAYLAASEAWRRSRADVVYRLGDQLRSAEQAAGEAAGSQSKEHDVDKDGNHNAGYTVVAEQRSIASTNLHVDADVLRERLHAAAGRPAPAWLLPISESKIDTMLDEMPSEAALRDETLVCCACRG